MNYTACHVQTDLSAVRLTADGASSAWSDILPRDLQETSAQSLTAERLRDRAVRAADWTASVLAGRRRLHLVALFADDMRCLWIKSPSADEPVLEAALRGSLQDWGPMPTTGLVQRLDPATAAPQPKPTRWIDSLRKPVSRRAASAPPTGAVVLNFSASLVTLWLDALDARGIRCDAVLSHWHAMALAWGTPGQDQADDKVLAVILHEPGRRTIWAWARGQSLLAGGTILDRQPGDGEGDRPGEPPNDERISARLTLDWLTWAAHLGACPAEVLIVGSETAGLCARLQGRFPGATIRAEPADDPILATIERAADRCASAPPVRDDPRRCVVALSNRPTRSLRTQYRWAAVGLVLLTAGLAGMGWRFHLARGGMSGEIVELEREVRTQVASLNDPSLLQSPNLVKALESKLEVMKAQGPPKLPPPPPPIHDEVRRLTSLLATFEGVRLVQLTLDVRSPCSLHLNIPGRRTGEEIKVGLERAGGGLLWTEGGVGSDQQLRLTGNWVR